MVIPPFRYYSPGSLEEALDILVEKNDTVLPLAGGTDIIVMMKEGRLKPGGLMSLKKIADLKTIETRDNKLLMGAGVTVGEIERWGVSNQNPAFGDLVTHMATRQIRNRATIGGNLCTAAACADFPPVLLVNDATVTLKNKKEERRVPLHQFFTGPRANVRQTGELLVSVQCRKNNPGTAYIKFGVRQAANISIVGIACSLEVTDGQVSDIVVASTAASPIPMVIEGIADIAVGKPPVKRTWEAAAQRVAEALAPISDLRGSWQYRLHLAKIGTVRALDMAYRRLNGSREVQDA
ncbi:MAG: xanthine dehydrogenase family protein subunit M [bacterium]|nr:xanthine dehydrogenase family protein subunit M [bacterium]